MLSEERSFIIFKTCSWQSMRESFNETPWSAIATIHYMFECLMSYLPGRSLWIIQKLKYRIIMVNLIGYVPAHCVLKIKNVLLLSPRRSKKRTNLVWYCMAEAKLLPTMTCHPAHSSASSGSAARPLVMAVATSLSNFWLALHLLITIIWKLRLVNLNTYI